MIGKKGVFRFEGLSNVSVIDILQYSDEELLSLSEDMGLALSLVEMKRIKQFFEKRL